MKFTLSINSLNPRQTDFFGNRALLAPQTLRSYLLHRDPCIDIILNNFNYEELNENIVSYVLSQDAHVISFSTYVWNIERIIAICEDIKQRKGTLIILGGPGSNYEADKIFKMHDCIDIVVLNEGEETLYKIIEKIKADDFDFHDIPNLIYRYETGICKTHYSAPLVLEEQNYILDTNEWWDCERVCYETSRGCVMKCKFCLWYKGYDSKVRFYPITKVKADLNNVFCLPRLKILEFVDADININKRRSLDIFQYIGSLNDQREKNGMNRVFVMYETNPEMLNDAIIEEMLRHDRIIDFGLQTINENLHHNMDRIFHKMKYLQNLKKIVTGSSKRFGEYMVEIIYGLPRDTLKGFKNTISFILSLPYEINLWSFRFLVMPGTVYHMEAEQFGVVFNSNPPYEIIYSDTWSEEDLNEARNLSFYFFFVQYGISEVFKMVDTQIHNSRKLSTHEAILKYYYTKYYKDLENLICNIGEETYQFQVCRSFSSDPTYHDLRNLLIQDSKDIIKRFA